MIMHRFDYIFMPLGTFHLVQSCEIEYASFSDHCLVMVEIAFNDQLRGPSLWKCNNSYLSDPEFIQEVNTTLDYVNFRYADLNPVNKWEIIKKDVRETMIECLRKKAAIRKKNIQLWNKLLTRKPYGFMQSSFWVIMMVHVMVCGDL